MDQVLFLFDLDQVLPVQGDLVQEEDQEIRLNLIKQTCLRILLVGVNRLNLDHRNLPHFGFRFFSSTDFYPTPEQISGSFVELNTENWENLESALEERLRIVVENAIKESTRNKTYFSTYMKSEGHKRPSEKIKMCLEDVTALFDWDRPTLQSPCKTVSNYTFCYNF
ncbi:uncharacterized protein LOC111717337 [Eurytemora carolleeae]|uniref:uncharacterized protein LOC111717337 n=1 Tax=Eurytemora carolleeae TaxID=1294199 RepID=UPI000C77EC4C|nr:uncharacterized protein LOC111717337 [Eurytemora carolleeae]|eukprot:XP_023348603.1 uncharacterized protein LOC111717337 [Eurytemora affinis]